MNSTATLKWVFLALLGIAVAAAVAIAAGNLASRQIGLASEPISAGDALAPAGSSGGGPGSPSSGTGANGHSGAPPAVTEPPPEPSTPPIQTRPPREGDDSSGSGHGGDSGERGADD